MENWLHRTELLLGKENIRMLQSTKVCIAGLGGVGSHAVEVLARSGVGSFIFIDFDKVNETNINRQIIALRSTIGKYKTEVMRDRVMDINPTAKIEIFPEFLSKENRMEIIKSSDIVIDAIDSIGPKMGMLKDLCELDIPFISVMGAGNRINAESIKITSIWKTQGCPLTKRLKKLLRRNGVQKDFQVVFSDELPKMQTEISVHTADHNGIRPESIPKTLVGSIAYMPAIMGMMAGAWVIRKICYNSE